MPSLPTVRCAALTMLLLVGCGEDGPSAPATETTVPSVPRTKQQSLTEAEWQKELVNAPDLKALADATGQPRQASGIIQDQAQNTLVWAEFAADSATPRTEVKSVFRLCDVKGKCTAGTAAYTASGATLQDAAGKAMTSLVIGAPVLLKDFLKLDLKNPRTIQAPLASDARSFPVDAEVAQSQVDAGGFKKRRFVVLNAFGPEVGVSVQPLAAAAQKLGLYDSVTVVDFARRADLLAIAPTLAPLDVLVWLGAGVREMRSGTAHTAGLTLSRGVFGDEMINVREPVIADLLTAPALGGPGLIVLAGSNTTAMTGADIFALANGLQGGVTRPVVGFGGKVEAAQAVTAVTALLNQLAAGKDLESALATAGHGMSSSLDKTARQKWKLPVKVALFWPKKPPSSAQLSVFFKVDPYCMKVVGDVCNYAIFKAAKTAGKQIPAESLSAGAARFECNPTFTGPWLECEGVNPGMGAKFTLKGLMFGTAVGDHMTLFIQGAASTLYQNVTVVGDAVFTKVDAGGGASTLMFNGIAAQSYYVNEDGYCCLAKQPLLEGATSAQLGTLQLSN